MEKEIKKEQIEYFYDYLIKVLSIAKIGLIYSTDPYAITNYKEIQRITMDALEKYSEMKFTRPNYFSRNVYPTPNVSVRVAIYNEKEEVLLVREAKEQAYCLPGGWCDLYDSPLEAARLESIQEAGALLKNIELIGILKKGTYTELDNCSYHQAVPEYQIVFRAELDGKLQEHEYETDDVGFYSLEKLPKLSKKICLNDWKIILKNTKERKIIVN